MAEIVNKDRCIRLMIICCLIGCFRNVNSTELVPVFMWESSSGTHPQKEVPALAAISADEFKDIMLQKLQSKPTVVVFAEENLSVEDFSWQDEAGEGAFPNLENVSRAAGGQVYLPFVHAPLRAFHHHLPIQDQDWFHLKLGPEGVISDPAALNATLLFVNLDDATDNEDRPDLLKRHDAVISQFYNMMVEHHDDVLAVYTAHHSSWQPGEETLIRRVRHLLAVSEGVEKESYFNGKILMYAANMTVVTPNKQESFVLQTLSNVTGDEELILNFTVNNEFVIVEFTFSQTTGGYWSMTQINVNTSTELLEFTVKNIEAPLTFSYHCTQEITFNNSDGSSFTIEKLQVQPFIEEETFGAAYDCVYFFTVPIWSGLFVCTLFSLIMAFGLCMIMDIKTMDRFDDPKGKTITINTSE